MEPKACGYCDQEITDNLYTYKWFPDDQQMKPVHNHHLVATRNMEKGKPYGQADSKS